MGAESNSIGVAHPLTIEVSTPSEMFLVLLSSVMLLFEPPPCCSLTTRVSARRKFKIYELIIERVNEALKTFMRQRVETRRVLSAKDKNWFELTLVL